MRLLWVNGRLGWPFVIAMIFITVTVVMMDFAWRIALIPFASLAAYTVIADLAAAALLIVGYLVVLRPRRTPSQVK